VSEVELARKGLIYLGERNVVREGKRFKIYLPKSANSLWEELSEEGKKVKVYVKV